MIDYINGILENMQKYFRLANVMDAVDIIIVTILIYYTIQLMRRSNALRVIQGVALLLVAMWAAELLGLYTMSFILSNTMQVGLLAIIIVFQPELRKMLEQIGSSKLSRLLIREQKGGWDTAIFHTVEACKALSWERNGALIVFEKNVLLHDIIKTGTLLDAEVSGELLKNIFFPKSPLHDGAVVIRDGRIAGASCMLPLSGNAHLSRDLGMRHRAALGMSENSDAICVVVSEETGSITTAQGGMMKRHLAPDTLEKILRNGLMPEEPQEKQKGIKRVSEFFKKRP
jgi:diadenylate cyclase